MMPARCAVKTCARSGSPTGAERIVSSVAAEKTKSSQEIIRLKQFLLILLAGAVVLVSVILVRTVLHQPADSEPVTPIKVALNAERAVRHMREAITFRTVSHQREADFHKQPFENFISWVEDSYPLLNDALELQLVGQYTLLYRWPGSNPELAPILLTGHYDVVPVLRAAD